ncbi:MAG: NAD-dependent epimerase/dehydratase family protein [Planctomycetota bacterium]|nr:NAD-dependent epimerase/dehydratase family protein [Planctomycetota bacterium]
MCDRRGGLHRLPSRRATRRRRCVRLRPGRSQRRHAREPRGRARGRPAGGRRARSRSHGRGRRRLRHGVPPCGAGFGAAQRRPPAAGVRRFVLAGSSSIYGDTPTLPKSESLPISPLSPYAASKAGAEALVHAYRRTWGLEGIILRFFNVYGPRQSHTSAYAGAIPVFLSACLEGRPCTLFGDGGHTRDFTFVTDTVDAIVRAAHVDAAAAEEAINIGAGSRRSVREILTLIEQVVGRELDLSEAPARSGDIRHSEADVRRAHAILDWQPQVAFEAGLRRTAEALRVHDLGVERSG